MLTRTQRRNGLAIIDAAARYGHHHGWDYKRTFQNCRMALMTPRPESGLLNIASANVPESQKYPHDRLGWTSDGLGHDHASMGMYQQQTGYAWTPANGGAPRNPATMQQSTMSTPNGWGTPEQLMRIRFQVHAFLDQMGREWWGGHVATTFIPITHSLGERCQLVQGSAFPGRYQTFAPWALRFMRYNLRFRRAWRRTRPKAV